MDCVNSGSRFCADLECPFLGVPSSSPEVSHHSLVLVMSLPRVLALYINLPSCLFTYKAFSIHTYMCRGVCVYVCGYVKPYLSFHYFKGHEPSKDFWSYIVQEIKGIPINQRNSHRAAQQSCCKCFSIHPKDETLKSALWPSEGSAQSSGLWRKAGWSNSRSVQKLPEVHDQLSPGVNDFLHQCKDGLTLVGSMHPHVSSPYPCSHPSSPSLLHNHS